MEICIPYLILSAMGMGGVNGISEIFLVSLNRRFVDKPSGDYSNNAGIIVLVCAIKNIFLNKEF